MIKYNLIILLTIPLLSCNQPDNSGNKTDQNLWTKTAPRTIGQKEAQREWDIIITVDSIMLAINKPDKDGLTPLMFEAKLRTCYPDKIRELISKGAKVNVQDNKGFSSLMWAVIYDNIECIKVLLQHGADINIYTTSNWLSSPIRKAIFEKDPQILNILLNSGQDINHVGPDGLTPLNVAEEYGKIEYSELFIKHEIKPDNKYFNTIEILNIKEDERTRNYKFFDLSKDTILIKMDLAETIENRYVFLTPLTEKYEEFEIEQQYETSMAISGGNGGHYDLLDWKHYTSEWQKINKINKVKFQTLMYNKEDWKRFPKVTLDELKQVTKDIIKRKECQSPNDSPCYVTISTMRLRITGKIDSKWNQLIIFEFKLPMGC